MHGDSTPVTNDAHIDKTVKKRIINDQDRIFFLLMSKPKTITIKSKLKLIDAKGITNSFIQKQRFDQINNELMKNSEFEELFKKHTSGSQSKGENSTNDEISSVGGYKTYELLLITKVTVSTIKDPKDLSKQQVKHSNDQFKYIHNQYLKTKVNFKSALNLETFFENNEYMDIAYLQENYKSNSCFLSMIINRFKDPIYKSTNRKDIKNPKIVNLTYEYLCKLCNVKIRENDIACSVRQMTPFFEKFKLSLHVFDINMHCIFKYLPRENKKICPNGLYCMIYNEHIFEFTENLQKLNKYELIDLKESCKIPVNRYIFHYKNQDKRSETKLDERKLIDPTNDELLDLFKTVDNTMKIIVYSSDLHKLFIYFVHDLKLMPHVKMDNGFCIAMSMTVNKSYIQFSNLNPDMNESPIDIHAVWFEKFQEVHQKHYKSVINTEHLSHYNIETHKWENQNYPITPLCGSFTNDVDRFMWSIDQNKAYSHCLANIEQYPVFNPFDTWIEYDEHKIEDYTQYFIRIVVGDVIHDNIEESILFSGEICRVYGVVLNGIANTKIGYDIISYKRPHKLIKTNNKQMYKDYWNTTISENNDENTKILKWISNKNIGLLEKKYNKSSHSKIFYDINEAYAYELQYGGVVLPIFEDKREHELDPSQMYTIEEDGNVIINPGLFESKFDIPIFYVWTQTKRTVMNEGFLPVKELIYCMNRLNMYNLYTELKHKGFNIVGCKTDCMFIDEKFNESKIDKLNIIFSRNAGDFKIENSKKPPQTAVNFNYCLQDIVMHPIFKENTINVQDEWDIKSLPNMTIVRSDVPGSGKSQTLKNLPYENKLFVCPWNGLTQEIEKDDYNAVTLYKLLGLNIKGHRNEKSQCVDLNQYDCIAFDEVYLHNICDCMKIYDVLQSNIDNDIKFFATGDPSQNDPVGNFKINETIDIYKYYDQLMNVMFKNTLNLYIGKRLESASDNQLIADMKHAFFNNEKPMTILEKYLKPEQFITNINQLKTMQNLSFFRYQRDKINKHCLSLEQAKRKKSKQSAIYWIGMIVVCKMSFKEVRTNRKYEIISIKSRKYIIKDIATHKEFEFNETDFKHTFDHYYCETGHSCQGRSINEPFTIFDVSSAFVSKRWIWTAISRSRRISDIHIFKASDNAYEKSMVCKFKLHWKNKVDDYLKQDMQNKNLSESSTTEHTESTSGKYVSPEWIMDTYLKKQYCVGCDDDLYMDIQDGKVITNVSVDRIDNFKGHFVDPPNCQLVCKECQRKSNCIC